MSDSAAARMIALRKEIGVALGQGTLPENQLREFRFLWRTTPDSEKENLSFTLHDIESMVKDMRRELSVLAGAGKLQRVGITYEQVDAL